MNGPLIVPIVEGDGEVEAIPVLIRRIFFELGGGIHPLINAPIKIKSGSFLSDSDYFRRFVELAAAKAAQGDGRVLIVMDCEDDCPAKVGPRLLADAQTVRPDVNYVVALAYREYETWFLTAAESLRGHRGLPENLVAPSNPESIRGAKEWLGRQMDSPYDPIVHQASFSARFNLIQARSNESFDRLIRVLLD